MHWIRVDVGAMKNFKRWFVVLTVPVFLAGCVTSGMLKINEVRTCLSVGADINTVTACIEKIGGYNRVEPYRFDWWWITEYCSNVEYKNCSSTNLADALTKTLSSTVPQAQFEIVAQPTIMFRSDWGSLGGSLVNLSVFYNKDSKKVIGWANMGSGLHRFDFRSKKMDGVSH